MDRAGSRPTLIAPPASTTFEPVKRPVQVLLLFTLSGFCALVYQILWVRWLGLLLGSFATAVALVVSTFMGGMAIGSAVMGRLISRRTPASALATYGILEAVLTGLAALSPFLLASSSPLFPALAAATAHPAARTLVCVLILLPPTFLMGGTLPVLVQALSAAAPRGLGALYSLNTLGGALGALLAAFALLPRFGLQKSMWVTCVLNGLVAAAALLLARRWLAQPPSGAPAVSSLAPDADPTAPASRNDAARFALLLACLSGFLSLGFEMALTRLCVLTITGGSVYGFSIILSGYLFGLALGAWLVRLRPPRDAAGALTRFAAAQGVAWLFALTTPFWDALPPLLVRAWWNPLAFGAISALNFLVVLLLLLTLTTAFGYSLPALAASLRGAGSAEIGRLFALNTVGAVLGALLTTFVLLRGLGLHSTLLALGGGALLVAAWAAARLRPWRRAVIAPGALLLAAAPFALPAPDTSIMNAGMYNRPQLFRNDGAVGGEFPALAARRLGRVVYETDARSARIAVRATSTSDMTLIVNGKPDASTSMGDMHMQLFLAHLPALAHPAPRSAFVIGLGTGITAGSLVLHEGLEEVHVAEIEPAHVDIARIFARHNGNVAEHPRVHIHLDDARRHLLSQARGYDLIVSGPSNLWVSGMVNLFTREFYELARRRLNPGGVFFQWLHYYQVSEQDLRGVLRTFQSVFPDSSLWIDPFGDAYLMAGPGTPALDPPSWTARMAAPELARDLRRIRLSGADLPGFFLWGPADIARHAGQAPLCTDDFPYLEFSTPRSRYTSRDTRDLRRWLQSAGPLEPAPLARENAALRLELGDRAAGRGSLVRALAEYRRALELDPELEDAHLKIAAIRRGDRPNDGEARLPAPAGGTRGGRENGAGETPARRAPGAATD